MENLLAYALIALVLITFTASIYRRTRAVTQQIRAILNDLSPTHQPEHQSKG